MSPPLIRQCRVRFEGGHVETVTLNLRDPFSRMDVLPLERIYGKVTDVTFAERTEHVDARDVFPSHNRYSRSLSR